MDLVEARDIVKALADGVNPVTGEVLPAASPYNNPAIIRALFLVSKSLKMPSLTVEERQQRNLKMGRPKNSGLPWSNELKADLAAKYKAEPSIGRLAKHFERSRTSIVLELINQGFIQESEKEKYLGQAR